MGVRPGYLGCGIGRLRLGLSKRLKGGDIEHVKPTDICVLTEQIMTVSESVRRRLYVYILTAVLQFWMTLIRPAYAAGRSGGLPGRTTFPVTFGACLLTTYIMKNAPTSNDFSYTYLEGNEMSPVLICCCTILAFTNLRAIPGT